MISEGGAGIEVGDLLVDLLTELDRVSANASVLMLDVCESRAVDTRLLRRVDASLVAIERAVEQACDLRGIETKTKQLSPAAVELSSTVLAILSRLFERAHVAWVPGSEVEVLVDPHQLAMAVSTLVAAGLAASGTTFGISVTVERTSARGIVSIAGMERAHQRQLALRTAREVARLHGGELEIGERDGTVEWRLALPVVRERLVAADASTPVVLLVDDNLDYVAALAHILGSLGYVTECATSGTQALARIAERMPAVLVVDIQLPDIGGAEVVRRTRKRHPELPVIVVSGYPFDHPLVKRATSDSRSRYIAKPLDVRHLRDLLDESVGRQA